MELALLLEIDRRTDNRRYGENHQQCANELVSKFLHPLMKTLQHHRDEHVYHHPYSGSLIESKGLTGALSSAFMVFGRPLWVYVSD